MKRGQILFAGIAALIMMSFTVAAKVNVLGEKLAKVANTTGCFTSVSTAGGPLTPPPANGSRTIPIAPPVLITSEGEVVADPDNTCNGVVEFCCFQVVRATPTGFQVNAALYKAD